MIDSDAFDIIFRRYYSPLLYFAMQYVNNRDECDDIVTSVFEDVWRNKERVHTNSVRPYLYTNVRNKCIDYLRKQLRHDRYVAFTQIMADYYIETKAFDEQEIREHIILQVLDELKPLTRDVLKACYIEGKKYKEVAKEMNMSVSNVKKHMITALKLLREKRKKYLKS